MIEFPTMITILVAALVVIALGTTMVAIKIAQINRKVEKLDDR